MKVPIEEEICSKKFRCRRLQHHATKRRQSVDTIMKLMLALILMLNNPHDDCVQRRDLVPCATFALKITAPTIFRGINIERRTKVSFSSKINISPRRAKNQRGIQFEQAQRRDRKYSKSSSLSSLSSSSYTSTALHMVLTTPESIIEQASTVNLLDDLINESVRTSARRPIMMQFDPSSGWIWRRWQGTVFSETWISCRKS